MSAQPTLTLLPSFAPEPPAHARSQNKNNSAPSGGVTDRAKWELLIDPSRHVVDGFIQLDAGSRRHINLSGQNRLLPGEAAGCHHAVTHPGQCGSMPACAVCPINRAARTALRGNGAVFEGVLELATGGSVEIEAWAEPVTDDRGVTGATVVVEGISDRKRRKALERAFLHDALNTISGVHGLLEIVREDRTAESADEMLDVAFERVCDLVDEIQGYRVLTDAEHGDLRAHLTRNDVRLLLDATVRRFKFQAEATGLTVSLDPATVNATVYTDVVLLRRILGNMIKNAIEASSTGDRIQVGAATVEGEVEIFVRNPTLMNPLVRMQVFRRSFTTKGQGRGLGTYSMKLLGEEFLGGRVGFRSMPPEGTRFHIRLPRAPALERNSFGSAPGTLAADVASR